MSEKPEGQGFLFKNEFVGAFQGPSPLVVGDGLGVDSMAMLEAMRQNGVVPDLIMFADTDGEKQETYDYMEVQKKYLKKIGFPEPVVVRYLPKDFKNYPPYDSLETNCLSNGTLPSLAFGYGSCSQKWKAAPQHEYVRNWQPAIDIWARGGRVRKAIGYDDSKRDKQRSTNAGSHEDPQYKFWYPLQEYHWDRERCIQEIVALGLPGFDPCYLNGKGPVRWIEQGGIPLKSSCFYCPAMKQWEVKQLPKDMLRRIVVMEARAKPRLEGHMTQEQLDQRYEQLLEKWGRKAWVAKKYGEPEPPKPKRKTAGDPNLMRGLWRNKMMTDFIRQEGLLDNDEIDRIIAYVPGKIISNQEAFRDGEEIPTWAEFFERLPSLCGEIGEDNDV